MVANCDPRRGKDMACRCRSMHYSGHHDQKLTNEQPIPSQQSDRIRLDGPTYGRGVWIDRHAALAQVGTVLLIPVLTYEHEGTPQ